MQRWASGRRICWQKHGIFYFPTSVGVTGSPLKFWVIFEKTEGTVLATSLLKMKQSLEGYEVGPPCERMYLVFLDRHKWRFVLGDFQPYESPFMNPPQKAWGTKRGFFLRTFGHISPHPAKQTSPPTSPTSKRSYIVLIWTWLCLYSPSCRVGLRLPQPSAALQAPSCWMKGPIWISQFGLFFWNNPEELHPLLDVSKLQALF